MLLLLDGDENEREERDLRKNKKQPLIFGCFFQYLFRLFGFRCFY